PKPRPGPTRKWVCWTSHAAAAAPRPDSCVRASSKCQPPAGLHSQVSPSGELPWFMPPKRRRTPALGSQAAGTPSHAGGPPAAPPAASSLHVPLDAAGTKAHSSPLSVRGHSTVSPPKSRRRPEVLSQAAPARERGVGAPDAPCGESVVHVLESGE